MIGQKSWDKLSADDQKLVQKIAKDTKLYERQVNRENNAKYLDLMKAKGIAVNEISAQNLDLFKASAKDIYAKFAGDIGKERLDSILVEVGKVK
jgi:TRAP-type C4-dicarboxylate transport system substrate-binding protein